ncbi:MAG TPA: PBP1A family penicillin-binding protein, partial [Terriglobales bacterium]|nr:PBP1A family penicillin-binding protein [Terriglobales bacterium]
MNSILTEAPPATPPKRRNKHIAGWIVFSMLVAIAAVVGAFAGILLVYSTDLPEVTELERYRPSSVTELYDDQGKVIGSFALQRRIVASYDDFPKVLRDAIISTEDKDFEKHIGVNVWRAVGAAYRDLTSGARVQGASTLTMQLARNLFLSSEKSIHRKLQEILLSIQIERRFTKQQIFTMYANQIFLGHGVYGFEAGSQYYFSKHAKDLTIEEAAVLAGLPKAPNTYSPINNPERSLRRRNLVINSMLEDGKITAAEAARAKNAPLRLHIQSDPNWLAPYFAEEVRRYLERKYGTDEVHESGLRVYTSLSTTLQLAANQAVLDGLAAYERRHGWKANLPNVIAEGTDIDKYEHPDWDKPIHAGTYLHALVTQVTPTSVQLRCGSYHATLVPADIAWTTHKKFDEILSRGDIVYVKVISLSESTAKVSFEQDSGAQGALLALDNATGDVKALVGGRDFDISKFNRATQAFRQVGSSFKPYVYSAAIEQDGATPDDVILDAPVTYNTASGPWSPHNYDNKFEGNITLRRALAQSRNVPAVKMAAKIGIDTVIEYARKFGITSNIPPVLPVALGSADLTLTEQVSGFTTFPNDGVRVVPRYIRKVEDYNGHVLEENFPEVKDVISAKTARTMTTMLREVVLHGTAFSASKINFPLAGKTGTTNDFTDAWFVGFSPSTTCGVWLGYDEKKTLGNKETGAMAA